MRDEEGFEEFFGFIQEEVDVVLRDADLWDKREEMRDWYNGYQFGKFRVYNPWSVISYVFEQGREPKPYWLNTSESAPLHRRLRENRVGVIRSAFKGIDRHWQHRYPWP